MDKQGAPCSLTEFVRDYYRLLYRLAYRMTGSASDAEDLTQQTFLAAQRSFAQLRDPKCAKSWLCAILRNSYRKSIRNRNGVALVSLDNVGEPLQECDSETRLQWHDVATALDELPDEFRIPLILFYFNEFSYKQIALQLDIPIGTVMSRLARGKAHLRRNLLPSVSASADVDADAETVRLSSAFGLDSRELS